MGTSDNKQSSQNKNSMTVEQVFAERDLLALLDVRKPVARSRSGLAIVGSHYRHPFDAMNWKDGCAEQKVLVYCVHGHEISQSVCGYLREEGTEAFYMENGFEGWREAGLPVQSIGVEPND